MLDSMKAGFMDATGIDPHRMKVVVLTLVFAVILMISAWIGKQILEIYSNGGMQDSEMIISMVMLWVVVFVTLTFLGWF